MVKAVIEEFGEQKPAAAADAEGKETTAASGPSPKKRQWLLPANFLTPNPVRQPCLV